MTAEIASPGIEARPDLADRLSGALLIVSIYLTLCVVYCVEAWARVTPWLFSDELEMTQLSRSIAATGHAARRGEPHSPDSLYTYLTAPLWLIHDVAHAYSAIKYLDVFVMTSVLFPTYFLARLVVRQGPALFAAIGAAAIPSLAYSSYLVQETLAYPYAALCLFLIAKGFVTRRRTWIAAALVASVVAPAIRGELVVVPAILLLTLLFALWSSERWRTRRASWSSGDWIGFLVLFFGAIFLFSGVASHHSIEWLTITRQYKHRIIDQGNWAAGSLAIGIGVIPMIAGLAALFRIPGEQTTQALRSFRCVSAAALISFGLYTAMKAAYLSTTFATRVEERNLIYIAPLLFVGTALVIEKRRVNLVALAAAAAYGLYLVGYAVYHAVGSPYEMGVQLYSDALGFAALQQANRYLSWTPTLARLVLLAVAVGGTAILLAPRFAPHRPRVVQALIAAVAIGIVAWNLTGEIAAAAGTISISRTKGNTLVHPFTWVDDATHLRPTLYMGEGESDPDAELKLEFWNRSIQRVSSLDGTVGGPGPAGGPDLDAQGTLFWGAPATYDFAVEDWCPPVLPTDRPWPCVDLAGARVASHTYIAGGGTRVWWLVRLTKPNHLRAMSTGISADGWTSASDSAYYRFSGPAGWLRVVVSRRNWGGRSGPSPVHIFLRGLVINANRQPIPAGPARQLNLSIDSTQTKIRWVRIPSGRVAVQVVVDRKFVPHEFDPSNSDTRQLGVQVEYRYFRTKP
jgi:hypothetical protein